MARTITRIVVPIVLVTAIALLIQGHNLPGGGFIAAVLTATAFALIYVIYGLDYIETELRHRTVVDRSLPIDESTAITQEFGQLVAAGLAIALLAGLAPVIAGFIPLANGVLPDLAGAPLFTQAVALVGVPIYGHVEVASALGFDIGVYVTVVGALLTILSVVGAQ
ncbi:MAG: MnhB domain-containing protein [Halococcoides sp.]